MAPRDSDEFPAEFHRDRREHGGAPQRLNDDQLAELTEEERVDAGLDNYDPDEVPPATDTPPPRDIRQDEAYEDYVDLFLRAAVALEQRARILAFYPLAESGREGDENVPVPPKPVNLVC